MLWCTNDKDFISQLKTLKEIRPQSAWLKSNREILFAQISNSGAEIISPWKKFLIDVRSLSLIVSKPAAVMAAMFMFLSGTAAFGHLALSQAKPEDSLYIARIISEKAKLTTIFNAEEKDKMQAKFAANHVEAIAEALARVNLEETGNEDKWARLNDSFNKEINIVREKMVAINTNNVKKDVSLNIQTDLQPSEFASNDDIIQAADNNKDDQGTQLFIKVDDNTTSASNTPSVDTTVSTDTEVKTTGNEKDREAAEAALADILDEVKDPQAMLEEVQVLFDAKNYQGALDKIREVKKMIK